MNKKTRLIFQIILESILTLGMLFDTNYWAASGWGFLALRSITSLMELLTLEKLAKNNNTKTS